jgi:ParB family chromosome partitioning protein
MRRGGLGRGLSSLIPGAEPGHGLIEIPVQAVRPNPRQPRKTFEEESLRALAGSIREVGILQPIVVRPAGDGYELIAGERRLRAARLAGLATVPAVLRAGEDGRGLREALIENIHRADLSPLELGAAFQELLEDLGSSTEEVAEGLGCSRAHVANTIRLLSLPADVQRLLGEGRIQAGHARALLGLTDDEARSRLALRIAAEGLSVRQVEELVRTYSVPRRPSAGRAGGAGALEELGEALTERLATRVRVSMGKRRGRIVIEVGSPDELDRLVGAIIGPDVVDLPEPADVRI